MPTVGDQRRAGIEVVTGDVDPQLREYVGPIPRARNGIDQATARVLGHERDGIGIGNGPAVLPDEQLSVRKAGHALRDGPVQTELADHRVAPEAIGVNKILDGIPKGIVDH